MSSSGNLENRFWLTTAIHRPIIRVESRPAIMHYQRRIMRKMPKLLGSAILLVMLGGMALAQRNARELPSHSTGTPEWTNDLAFEKDVFTFVRIKYIVDGTHGWGHTAPDQRWLIDAPDSDLNF